MPFDSMLLGLGAFILLCGFVALFVAIKGARCGREDAAGFQFEEPSQPAQAIVRQPVAVRGEARSFSA
jgi:hypothetical protein